MHVLDWMIAVTDHKAAHLLATDAIKLRQEFSGDITNLASAYLEHKTTIEFALRLLKRGVPRAAQNVLWCALNPDPWMDEPLTPEEQKAVDEVKADTGGETW